MIVKCVGTPLSILLPYIKPILISYGILDVLYCDDRPLDQMTPKFNLKLSADHNDDEQGHLRDLPLDQIMPKFNLKVPAGHNGVEQELLGHLLATTTESNCYDILKDIDATYLINTWGYHVSLEAGEFAQD